MGNLRKRRLATHQQARLGAFASHGQACKRALPSRLACGVLQRRGQAAVAVVHVRDARGNARGAKARLRPPLGKSGHARRASPVARCRTGRLRDAGRVDFPEDFPLLTRARALYGGSTPIGYR